MVEVFTDVEGDEEDAGDVKVETCVEGEVSNVAAVAELDTPVDADVELPSDGIDVVVSKGTVIIGLVVVVTDDVSGEAVVVVDV